MSCVVEFFYGALKFNVNNVAFSIGDFEVYWYGIIIALGFIGALVYAYFRSAEFGIDFDKFIDVIIVGSVGAILCARAYYVFIYEGGVSSIGEFFDLRSGGLAIYGAVIGAGLCCFIMCKIKKMQILPILDLLGIGLLFGQAVGRWGNFFNQEAFGCNTTLPCGMWSTKVQSYLTSVQYDLAAQGVSVDPTMPVHPCFLYESIWCLAGFVLLHFLSKKRSFRGETFLMYLVWYGFGRFFIEGLRTDSLMIGSVRASQAFAALCVVAGLALLIIFKIKNKGNIINDALEEQCQQQ